MEVSRPYKEEYVTVKQLDIYLKNHPHPGAREYLSEDDLELSFSPLQKVCYGLARPLMPLFIRHWLQTRYTRAITCRSEFICADLVNLLKRDERAWDQFTRSLYPGRYRRPSFLRTMWRAKRATILFQR